MNRSISFVLCLFLSQCLYGQKLVQFSGVVVDADSLNPVPFSNVIIKNTNTGTASDFFGFFSFVAQPGDSILFSSLGYHTALYVIPDTLDKKRYSIIQVLEKEYVQLDEVKVYPWPSRQEFKEAFMNLRIPNNDQQRAIYNLEHMRRAEKFSYIAMDAEANYKNNMKEYQTKLYNSGLYPVNNLLNPTAWYSFIQEWKKGTYKKKKARK